MDKGEYFRTAGELLRELGIAAPEEIDVEAIAFYCGATIKYKRLTGCAARIVGDGTSAIITIDSGSPLPRQRFSASHELGHWMHDRGKASFSCEEGQFVREWTSIGIEARANRYASDLLLPLPMFKPRASGFRSADFDVVRFLAEVFNTSLPATAIRLVEHGPFPAMLTCYSASKRLWFVRPTSIDQQLWPSAVPGRNTCAHQLLTEAGGVGECRDEVPATAWFDHDAANGHYIREHSIRVYGGAVLSLVWWKNERMLIELSEYEDERAARRADGREED
jgi:hypothetical protein